MAHTRATRYFLSDRVLQPRRNYEEIGSIFRLNSTLIAQKGLLDAEFSAKALNASKDGKDSEKRTSGGVAERIPELRYSPNAKRKPGQVLKLHVTAKDLLRSSDEPNFGWVDAPEPVSPSESKKLMDEAMAWKKRRPKIRIRTFDIDPRTGGRVESSAQEIDVKGLGRSIGRMVPGGNLASRAAGALGVITDENGKFRCPPGTPAANQFTDEFGTNCFVPPISSMRALGRLRGWFNHYAAAGRLAWEMDRDPNLDPEFQANRRAMAAASEMLAPQQVFDQRKKETEDAIKSLQALVGATTDTDNNAHLWDTLAKLKETDRWDIDFSEAFTGITGGESLWDDSLSLQENLDNLRQTIRSQYLEWTNGDNDAALELAKRHEEVTGGVLEGLLQEFYEGSESVGQIRRLRFRQRKSAKESIDDFWNTDGEMVPNAFDPDSGFGLTMEFNPTALALRPIISNGSFRQLTDGKYVVVDTDGVASEGEQWAEIASMMRGQIDLERWMGEFATDLSTARHQSIRAAGRHLAFHEVGHAHQYLAAKKAILDHHAAVGHIALVGGDGKVIRVTDSPDTWTNDMWHGAMNQLLQSKIPEEYMPKDFPPVGVAAFEGSMLHILSGQYYQELVQAYWGPDGRGPQDRSLSGIALMEGMTELRALKKMGVIDSELIDEHTAWMDGPQTPGTITRPPTPPRVNPPGSPDVKDPDTPSTPESEANVGVIPHGIAWGIDAETGEIFPSQGPYEMMERYFKARFGGRPDDKRGGSQEIPRQAIARQWGWADDSYAQMSPETLDSRFETLQTDADALIARIDAGETLDLDDRTRLWLATKGMAQISDENARRINASDAQRQDREVRFQRTEPGKYFRSGGKKPYKKNQREGVDTIWDEKRYREEMRKLEEEIIQLDPDVPSWTKDPDGYGAKQAQKARRKMTQRERDAMSKSLTDMNTGYVFGGSTFEELLKTHANRVRAGETPRTPTEVITEDVLPVLDALDAAPLEEAIEVVVPQAVGMGPNALRPLIERKRFLVGLVQDPEQRADLDLDGGGEGGGLKMARVYLPAGSKGFFRENEETGEMNNVLLPAGQMRVIDSDNGAIPVLTPARQESASDYAERMLRDLDNMGPATSVTERRERENLRSILEPRVKNRARPQMSAHSDDPAVRHAMESKRNALAKRFNDAKITPFNINKNQQRRPDELDVDSTFDNAADVTLRGMSRGDESIDLTDEARDYLDRYGKDAATAVVADAAEQWHNDLDKRPRVQMNAEELEQFTYDDSSPVSGVFAQRVAENFGWPANAAPESYPAYGMMFHESHWDKYQLLLGDVSDLFPARKRAEFFDAGDRNPTGADRIMGDIEVVLRPEVSHRTGYGLGDITERVGQPLLVNANNKDDIVRSLVSAKRRGRANSFESGKNFGNLLNAGVSGNFDGMQHRNMKDSPLDPPDFAIEAAIAGGFQPDEVESLIIPTSSLPWQSIRLSDARAFDNDTWVGSLKADGWSEAEIDFLRQGVMDGSFDKVTAANLLRQHIAATSNKRMYERMGMDTRYTNTLGVDLFNKRDLSEFTDSGSRIGRVRSAEEALRVRVGDEIASRQQELRTEVQGGMRSIRNRIQSIVGDRVAEEASSRIGRLGRRLPSPVENTGIQRVGMSVINSDRLERIMRRAGLETDEIDNIRFVGEMAAAFGTSGPAGVGIVLARRGSREGIEYGVRKAIEQGWINDTQARRILRAADTVAPEGLPDAVTNAIGETARDAWDSAAAEKARELAEAAAEKVRELSIVDRVDDIFDSARDRFLGRSDAPETPAIGTSSNDPFGFDPFEGGLRSGRSSSKIKESVPAFNVSSLPKNSNGEPDYSAIKTWTYGLNFSEDAFDQPPLQRVFDALGGAETRIGDKTLGEIMQHEGPFPHLKLPSRFASGWGTDPEPSELDQVRAAIEDLADPELRQSLLDDLDAAEAVSQLSMRIRDALPEDSSGGGGRGRSAPPPRRSSDPFADDVPDDTPPAPPKTPEQVQSDLDAILDEIPERVAENWGRYQEESDRLKEVTRQRKNMKTEVERELMYLEEVVGKSDEFMRTRQTPGADKDRTAEVGQAAKVKTPDIDVTEHEPTEGVVRGHAEINDLSIKAHQVADSLVAPEHRDELASLIRENPEILRVLDTLRTRRTDGGQAEYNLEDKTGSGYAGRELIDALIEVRGYDGANLRVSDDELEQVIYVSGATPLSRGGNAEMQRRHIENEDLPIGEGVDGAGLYFAVDQEAAQPNLGIGQGHDAARYAGENGAVIRGAIAPSAKMTTALGMQNAIMNYEQEMLNPGSAQSSPIVDLRRAWAGDPASADLVEALDLMLGSASTDSGGEFVNGRAAAAILMGYDGMNSYGSSSGDNRVILFNRTAMLVSTRLQSAAEYTESRPWEKLQERAAAIASSLDIPIGLSGEERTEWVLAETERRLEAINA